MQCEHIEVTHEIQQMQYKYKLQYIKNNICTRIIQMESVNEKQAKLF